MDLSALQSALNKEFQEPMSDMIVRDRPLLSAMPKKAMATDRIYVRNQIGSSHSPRAIADGATVTISSPGTTYGAGVLDWTTYISEFKLSKRLLAQVVGNPALIGQLFQNEIKNATLDLADQLAQDLFKDTATYSSVSGVTGLKAIMNDGNTYAGIDRSVGANAYWRGNVVDAQVTGPAVGPLSTSLMYLAEKKYYEATKRQLFQGNRVIFTSKDVELMYKEMFEQIDYGSLSSAHFVNQANGGSNFGKMGVSFNGAPLIPESNIDVTGDLANSARLYIMNPDAVFLASLTPNDDPEVVRMQQLDPSKAPDASGLNVQIEILGNQGEFVAGYVKTYVQLVCMDPRAAGVVIKNVDGVYTV